MPASWLLYALFACLTPAPPEESPLPDSDHDGIPDIEDCAPGDASLPADFDPCNGFDEDCDGTIDEDAETTFWFGDADGDGAGDPADSLAACSIPPGYVATQDDCDPGDPSVYPGAPETCDLIDNDCDGVVDDITDPSGDLDWYRDADGDGWGIAEDVISSCFFPEGYVRYDGDCDDANPDINPGAAEVCDDADVDEDCDGLSDENDWAAGKSPYYADDDGDGWGGELQWTCEPDGAEVTQGGDCDDGNADISPGAVDECGDRLDADCDGEASAC